MPHNMSRLSPETVMTNPVSWVAAVVLVGALASPAIAQERPVAGRIKNSTGSVFIVRDGNGQKLAMSIMKAMSAFRGNADIERRRVNAAYDPKQTSRATAKR